MVDRLVMWDFDGTLATQPRGNWGAALLEVLDTQEPGHTITLDAIRPHLKSGFPWHRYEDPHLELCEPDSWWRHMEKLFAKAFTNLGFGDDRSAVLACGVRGSYLNRFAWEMPPEARPALEKLKREGWTHVIVSNHVPELEWVVENLGLNDLIARTFSSAVTGYEKPHPEAFRIALRAVGEPEQVWMVGDNPIADVAGAERLGIPAILIRAEEMSDDYVALMTESYAGTKWQDWRALVKRRASDLTEVASIIES